MGQLVFIKLKTDDDQEINKINEILKSMKIDDVFITEEMNKNWLMDINNGVDGHKHLRPEGRDLTMKELKKQFISWTEVGLISFDVAFGRTSQAQAKRYAKFILANRDLIDYIKGADSFIERYKLTQKEYDCIKALDKPKQEPEKLDVNKQTKPTLTSGQFLCKSFSPEPFWVIYGKVEHPSFLKTKVYVDDLYNDIYRDNNKHAYLMLPLLPIDDKQIEFVERLYNEAFSMGLREDYNFIIPYLYKMTIVNYDNVVESYKEWYTLEELKDRFMRVFGITHNSAQYGISYNLHDKKFKTNGGYGEDARCGILTCLLRAMGGNEAAEIMSKVYGKKYIASEF